MKQIISKAAILRQINKPLEISNILVPSRLFKGQVLVKMMYSGICGSQLGEIQGIKGKDKYLPHLLGHEGSGVVIEVGPKVTKVKPKDKVVLHWIKGSGLQSETPKYSYGKKKINAGWVTTFNEYAVVSENRLTKIKSNYPLKKAALFGCCATTSLSLVFNKLKLKSKDKLLIVGIGGLGQVLIQGSKISNLNLYMLSILIKML